MKCCCCDRNLSDYESTQRHAETGAFLDMCNKCLVGLGIPSVGREDLSKKAEEEEYEYDLSDVVLDLPTIDNDEEI